VPLIIAQTVWAVAGIGTSSTSSALHNALITAAVAGTIPPSPPPCR
jgi:hypothetical protein